MQNNHCHRALTKLQLINTIIIIIIIRAMLAVAYATGRASHARQVKGDDPDKEGYPGPPGWVFGVGLTTPHSKKPIVTKVEQREKLDGFNDDGESW
jgi:hypothetical protein